MKYEIFVDRSYFNMFAVRPLADSIYIEKTKHFQSLEDAKQYITSQENK